MLCMSVVGFVSKVKLYPVRAGMFVLEYLPDFQYSTIELVGNYPHDITQQACQCVESVICTVSL